MGASQNEQTALGIRCGRRGPAEGGRPCTKADRPCPFLGYVISCHRTRGDGLEKRSGARRAEWRATHDLSSLPQDKRRHAAPASLRRRRQQRARKSALGRPPLARHRPSGERRGRALSVGGSVAEWAIASQLRPHPLSVSICVSFVPARVRAITTAWCTLKTPG